MFHTKPSAQKLNFHLQTQGEVGILPDTRLAKKNKNLGKEQRMSPSLDQDLRKYFGFGKKHFKNIVKTRSKIWFQIDQLYSSIRFCD